MGKSNEQIQNILFNLRSKNDYDTWKVSQSLRTITDEDLKDKEKLNSYYQKIYELRIDQKLTTTDVGNRIGLSHTTISNHENRKYSLDKLYLEIFSLFYEVSPIFLLGITNNKNEYILSEGIIPMQYSNAKIEAEYMYIILNFVKIHKNIDMLIDICKWSQSDMKSTIKKILISIPNLSTINVPNIDIIAIEKEYRIFREQHFTYSSILYNALEKALPDLYTTDKELFDVIRKISTRNDLIVPIHNFIRACGFMDNL